MAERRVGVRVAVTGDNTNEFRDLAKDAALASAAIKGIPNRVSVRADSSGVATLERRAQQAQRSSSLLVDSVAMLAPTLSPLSAVAAAGLGGLANQAAIAGGALATTLLALSGVADGIKALEKARLEPTAENLQAAREALAAMPADAAEFTRYIYGLRPVLDQLQATSANGGFLTGLTAGIDSLLTRLPQIDSVIGKLSAAQGALSRRAGAALAGPEFDDFFEMLDRTAKPTLMDLGSILGSLAQTGANLWTALEPLNMGFSRGLREMAAGLEQWSATSDFTGFIDYVRESAPVVLDTLGSLASAFGEIVQAGAPLGGPTLLAIKAVSDALSAIADSPAGPALLAAAAGFAALNRALVVQTKLRDSLAGGLIFGRGAASADSQVASLGRVEAGVRTLPAAMREAKAAQASLTVAQRDSARASGAYSGQLRAANEVAALGMRRTAETGRDLSRSLATAQAGHAKVAEAERRATAATTARNTALRASVTAGGKAAAGGAALAVVMSGAADGIGLTNTAMLGLAGSMAGPLGAAAGGAIGVTLDLAAANDDLRTSLEGARVAAERGDIAALADQLKTAKSEYGELAGLDAGLGASGGLGKAVSFFTGPSDEDTAKVRAADAAYRDLRETYAGLGQEMGRDVDPGSSVAELARVARDAGPAMRDLGISASELREMNDLEFAAATFQIANYRQEADLAAGSTREFSTAMVELNEVLKERSALRDYEAAIDAARKAAKENGQTLDENFGKGRANAAALDAIAASAANAAQQLRPLARERYMEGATQEFIKAAKAMGLGTEEAIRLAGELKLIPRQRVAELIVESRAAEARAKAVQRLVDKFGLTKAQATALLNDQASGKIKSAQQLANKFGVTKAQAAALLDDLASGKLRSLLGLMASVDGKTARTVTYNDIITRYSVQRSVSDALPPRGGANAAGGLWSGNVRQYAGGGMDGVDLPNAHRPHIAKAGTWRVFAEDETGGEAYIPLRNDWRRPRAKSIAEETARILGGRIEWNAAGSLRPALMPSSRPAVTTVQVNQPSAMTVRIPGMGDFLAEVIDSRVSSGIADYDARQSARARTRYGG